MAKQFEIFDTFSIKMDINKENKNVILSDSSNEVKSGYSLVCEIDATHAGTLINNRVYPPEFMDKGIKTWTKPYKKPVLINHDDTHDPIGRVIKAKYIKTSRGIDSGEYRPLLKASDGYGFQRLTVKVTDPDAIQKIIDGRYETVSVRITTNHAFCSICNVDWSDEGPCDHMLGQKYEGKLAYITTGDLSYRELSFVNIPADEFAGVREASWDNGTEREPVIVPAYANSSEDKYFINLGTEDGNNLYSFLDSEGEEGDEVILHLLEKFNKVNKIDKEEDVKLDELTKDQLKELNQVKELIEEAVVQKVADTKNEEKKSCDLRLEELRKELESGGKSCDARIAELKKEWELNSVLKADYDKVIGELNILKASAVSDKDAEIKKLTDEIASKDEDRKKLLNENSRINSDLHKMVAERLYDLKKILRKPDVVAILTPDAHDKKVEEFAQRSIDSLKDQIRDLLLEQETFLTQFSGTVSNPGLAQDDKTNTVDASKTPKKETKKDTLKRLFS